VRRIFPSLADRPLAEVDMDAAYRAWSRAHPERFVPGGANPYLDPAVAVEVMDEIARLDGAWWFYGGYLEERRHILAGSYLEATGNFLHLGVDVHVPEGTPLAAGAPATVLRVDDDGDRDGGWGPRVFLRRSRGPADDTVAIFAHLREPRCAPGDVVGPEETFAEVGGPPHNGNWHPHLHLQVLRAATFEEAFVAGTRELDGYGAPAMRGELAALFPDPLRWW